MFSKANDRRSAALSNDDAKDLNKWAARLRWFVTDVCALQEASDLIRDQFFGGECILFQDAIADLEQQTKILQRMIHGYDRVVIDAGQPELAKEPVGSSLWPRARCWMISARRRPRTQY